MGYKLAIRVVKAPLAVEHAILWLDKTPDSGYFRAQHAWNATLALDPDDPYDRLPQEEIDRAGEAERARSAKINAMRNAMIEKARKNGPLRNAIIKAAGYRKDEVDRLVADPEAAFDAVATTLDLGDAMAYVDGNPIAKLLANARVLSLDDADAIVAAVERARDDVAAGNTRIPAEFAREIPFPNDVRTFVDARIGAVVLIDKA